MSRHYERCHPKLEASCHNPLLPSVVIKLPTSSKAADVTKPPARTSSSPGTGTSRTGREDVGDVQYSQVTGSPVESLQSPPMVDVLEDATVLDRSPPAKKRRVILDAGVPFMALKKALCKEPPMPSRVTSLPSSHLHGPHKPRTSELFDLSAYEVRAVTERTIQPDGSRTEVTYDLVPKKS